jgi:hypothetical protein
MHGVDVQPVGRLQRRRGHATSVLDLRFAISDLRLEPQPSALLGDLLASDLCPFTLELLLPPWFSWSLVDS